MKYPIGTFYLTSNHKISIQVQDEWSFVGVLSMIFFFLGSKKRRDDTTVFSSFFPFKRFRLISLLNQKILEWNLYFLVKNVKFYALWIENPDFFYLHNIATFDYLLFDCNHLFLSDKNKYIRYRDCFEKRWVFAYDISGKERTLIFKNESESEIMSKLQSI